MSAVNRTVTFPLPAPRLFSAQTVASEKLLPVILPIVDPSEDFRSRVKGLKVGGV